MSLDNVRHLLEDAIRDGKTGGAAIAAGRAGEMVFETSAGLASTATIFDAGSMTQALATSTMAAALAAEHGINLNAPVSRWWPEFGEEGKEKVSLRHLLKHTSGLPANRPYYQELLEKHPDWIGKPQGRDFILDRVADEGLEYPPTYMLVPSNIGYLALGHVVEMIGDEPLAQLFDRIVARPLGLSDASFGAPADKQGRCASSAFCPHRGRLLRGEVLDPNAWAMGGVAGHAGLFITASDAARIGMALVSSLKTEGGPLPRGMIGEFLGPRARYKLGWDIPNRGNPICGSRFSANTIGHVSQTGASLWIDLDEGIAVAAFATFPGEAGRMEKSVRDQLPALLPPLHDAIMDAIRSAAK